MIMLNKGNQRSKKHMKDIFNFLSLNIYSSRVTLELTMNSKNISGTQNYIYC